MAIHQEIEIPADPSKVYAALTTADRFAAFTGEPAQIDARAGGPISLFGGKIGGVNVELEPNRRVVQAWRAGNWPEGVFSIVRFELAAKGDATQLTFDQSGYPPETQAMLEGGWSKMYWEPLSAHLSA